MDFHRAANLMRSAATLALLSAVLTHVATSQAQTNEAELTDDQEQHRFVVPTTRDGIGRIVANVMINGSGPFRFVVDTGATHSAVSKPLAEKLNLANQKAGAPSVLLSGVTGSAQVAIVRVESLEVGKLSLGPLDMPVIEAVLADADGVLGADAMEDSRLTIDFKNDRILIEKSSFQAAPRYFYTVPVRFGFGRLLLADATIGKVRVKAIIDTGAQRTLGNISLRNALRIGRDSARGLFSTDVEGVTADLQPGDVAAAPTLSMGAIKIGQTDITFGDLHVFKVWGFQRRPAVLIGMDVLGVLDMLIIDYRRKELQVLPAQAG
ncbi:MAG TPA: aspartyl protease family protein [Steroidobacteraceae bacterium]|nr:aspartyl protease family protein [Steroidobacteraceae bacterium]